MSVKQPTTPEAIRSRIVGHGDADPAELVANPRNWRTHPPEQRAALIAELDRVGFVQSVVVNRTTGHLVDGHLRVEVAAERGVGTIPVVYVELSPEEEARVLVALDPLGSMAGTNDALLQDLLDGLDLENRALEQHLVSFMATGRRGTTDPEAVPAVPDESAVYVRHGDVWVLGDHRIMCGDSTKAEDVARLMDGQRASLLATDPPYLVDYKGGNHPGSGPVKAATKDKHWDDYTDPTTGTAFYVDFINVAKQHLEPNVAVYQWYADVRRMMTQEAWIETGILMHQTLIWVKSRGVLTRSDFMWQHEPCLYGWFQGSRPPKDRRPPPNSTSVWTIAQAGEQDGIHPTQKPVEIFHRPIEWHTKPGEVCYEPFSGSGTQIIAAERLGRRCFAMELSPAFVQVAIVRWQEFTGREAVRG
jgi:DNA modification methylase